MKKLLFIALLWTLQSCSIKSKIDNIVPALGGSMTANIDGAAFKATTVLVTGKVTSGTLFSIGGASLTSKNGIGVNFDLTKGKVEEGKTYTCGYNTVGEITHEAESGAYYLTDTNQGGTSGTIKIDKYDGSNVSGTFSGKLYSTDTKKTVSITNGVFSGKVTL